MSMLRKALWTAVAVLLVFAAGIILSRTDAVAQLRAALVKNVDEPARTPYEFEIVPSKPFGNVYYADFPAVPAGKRLKLTRISGFVWGVSSSNLSPFIGVEDPGASIARVVFPLAVTPFAYYGYGYSFNQEVDYIFEAGQSPRVELGVAAGSGGLPTPSVLQTKFRAHGYLVDLSL